MPSPLFLLDSNVLIALATPDHSAHLRARTWFEAKPMFATCPMTEGALIRFHMRFGQSGTFQKAQQILRHLKQMPTHEFWPDDLEYTSIPAKGIVGHKQVTDAYIAALADSKQGQLATLDEGLAALHPAAFLIPTL
ncbi:MAG: type II toxin-antitoxin system ribonuclease VapC29 [Bryobacter sp.]